MKIKSTAMAIIIFLVVFGGIGATMALGLWTTTSDKKPAKYRDGAYAGQNNPADIRGSYTFTDIASAFEMDARTLLIAFGFPADKDPAQTKAKDLEARYAGLAHEIGTGSVRLFVALYKGVPITLDGTYLPAPAVPLILAANPKLSAEQKAYLDSHQVDLGAAAAGSSGSTASSTKGTAATEPLVNGTATFQQLLDAGITRAQIEQVLGAPMPPTNQSVRDYCNSNGIPFSNVKNALNALVPAR